MQELLRKVVESALHLVPRGKIHLEVRARAEGLFHSGDVAGGSRGNALRPRIPDGRRLGAALGLSIVRKRLDRIAAVSSVSTSTARAGHAADDGPVSAGGEWSLERLDDSADPAAPLRIS